MNKMKFIILFIFVLLTGCLSPVKTANESSYVINTLPAPIQIKRSRPITLLVQQPDTSPSYNTTQMAYTTKPFQISYFSQNRWAETPAQMMQPLMVQALQNTHYFHAVVTPPFVGHYDYILSTQILRVQQSYFRHYAMFEFVVRAQITKVSTNQVIATQLFCINEPIRVCSPYGGVLAANSAGAEFLHQLTFFCLHHM